MKYLKIKGIENPKYRKNGTRHITPIFQKKTRKYGHVQEEAAISRKKNIIIAGAHDSGKSRFLERLHEYAFDIWGGHNQIKGKLFFDQIQPLSAWYEDSALQAWYESKARFEREWKPWQKLKAYEKVDLLPQYCKSTNAALFIDNADKLTQRKLAIANSVFWLPALPFSPP